MHASEDDLSDSEAFVADEEGVLAEGDQVVAEHGESDGACGRCTCLKVPAWELHLCLHSVLERGRRGEHT